MKITSKNNSKILGIGLHLVTIVAIALAKAKASDLYKDITEQLAMTFKDANGLTITRWFNLKGYQLDADQPSRKDDSGRDVPNYAVGEDGNRIEDPAKTESALGILARLGFDCGISEGSEFDTSDLEGLSVGIMVEFDSDFNSSKVAYSVPAAQVGAAESAFETEPAS